MTEAGAVGTTRWQPVYVTSEQLAAATASGIAASSLSSGGRERDDLGVTFSTAGQEAELANIAPDLKMPGGGGGGGGGGGAQNGSNSFKQFKDDQKKWRQMQELLHEDSSESDDEGGRQSKATRFRIKEKPEPEPETVPVI